MSNLLRVSRYATSVLLVLLTTFPWSVTSAQQAPKHAQAAWVNEPTSFMGVALGKSLPNPRDCPKDDNSCRPDEFGRTMYDYRDVALPDLGFPYAINVDEIDFKVSRIDVNTEGVWELRAATIAKFGPPTESRGCNQAGDCNYLLWEGKTVKADWYHDIRFNQATTTVYYLPLDNLYHARVDAQDAASAAKAASKM